MLFYKILHSTSLQFLMESTILTSELISKQGNTKGILSSCATSHYLSFWKLGRMMVRLESTDVKFPWTSQNTEEVEAGRKAWDRGEHHIHLTFNKGARWKGHRKREFEMHRSCEHRGKKVIKDVLGGKVGVWRGKEAKDHGPQEAGGLRYTVLRASGFFSHH